MMEISELAQVLAALGCPEEKSAEMAAQLDKRARQLAAQKGRTYEDYVGLRGLERTGKKRWARHVFEVVEKLKAALGAEYVVLGGGNAKLLKDLPPGARLGENSNALKGGIRLFQGGKADAV